VSPPHTEIIKRGLPRFAFLKKQVTKRRTCGRQENRYLSQRKKKALTYGATSATRSTTDGQSPGSMVLAERKGFTRNATTSLKEPKKERGQRRKHRVEKGKHEGLETN